MAKELEAVKRPDRGVVVPAHKAAPYDKDNIHLSKAQFIAKEKARKEKAIKVAEFAAGLDKPELEKTSEAKVEAPNPVAKSRGRPKKIE